MWLRLALKLLPLSILISACSHAPRQAADKLNSLSYAYHYRSLDSTEYYAQQAFSMSADYSDGRAEALNNRAFVCIARMRYADARQMLDEIQQTTDNQLELHASTAVMTTNSTAMMTIGPTIFFLFSSSVQPMMERVPPMENGLNPAY